MPYEHELLRKGFSRAEKERESEEKRESDVLNFGYREGRNNNCCDYDNQYIYIGCMCVCITFLILIILICFVIIASISANCYQ